MTNTRTSVCAAGTAGRLSGVPEGACSSQQHAPLTIRDPQSSRAADGEAAVSWHEGCPTLGAARSSQFTVALACANGITTLHAAIIAQTAHTRHPTQR